MSNDNENAANSDYLGLAQLLKEGLAVLIDGRIRLVNPALSRILGTSEEEIEGREIIDFIDNRDIEIFQNSYNDVYQGLKESALCTVRLKKNEKVIATAEIRITSAKFGRHNVIILFLSDITEQVELRSFIDSCLTRYEKVWETSPIAIFVISPTGIIQDLNPAAWKFLGIERELILKRSITSFIASDNGKELIHEIISEVMNRKTLEGLEFLMKTGSNEVVWVNVTASYMQLPEPSILLLVQNINLRKNAEQRAKSEREHIQLILEIMTHDMNNINQSLLFAFGLIEQDMGELHAETIRNIQWDIKRSARTIMHLKLIIQLMQSSITFEKTAITNALKQAVGEVREDMFWKNLFIETDIEEDAEFASANQYLTNVFFNIIHNSMLYNDNEDVRGFVKAYLIHRREFIQVEISDNSKGIPDELKEWVFKRTGSPESQKVGRGLGLTLVDKIIRSYGGKIWIENRVSDDYSKGVKFIIQIPRWIEKLELACGRSACITFYKSDHCFFCEPVHEILVNVMDEFEILPSIINEINVDDPNVDVALPNIPMFPFIEICDKALMGFVEPEEIKSAIMNLLLKPCVQM